MGKGERRDLRALYGAWRREIEGPSTPRSQQVHASTGQEVALVTGNERMCRLEGCTGVELELHWPDHELTWVCTKALRDRPDGRTQIA